MKPICYDITVYQNASYELKATFKDPNGTPIDLSAYSGELVVRQSVALGDSILRVDDQSGNVIFQGAVTDNITIRLSATETDQLPTNNVFVEGWHYEFKIWETANPEYTTIRLLEGEFNVSPSVSRPDNT